VSQRAYLVTGNHDFRDPGFAYFGEPITVGAGAWISAGVTVAPGARIPDRTIVPIGSVWTAR
jgi:putative colanic acid biosynthesis acetyltransferase WcaF